MGLIARQLLGGTPEQAEIVLHGSFAATGSGHGTDRALVAGLLGMEPDDPRIPNSYEVAQEEGLHFTMVKRELRGAHPNTAELTLTGKHGARVQVRCASIGGGRIQVNRLDGISVNFSGEHNTLIVHNEDRPGLVAEVTALLANDQINIATMQLFRDKRGGTAVMVAEIDHALSATSVRQVEQMDGVIRAIYIDGRA
jgi:L-serine dehydratase